MEYTAGTDWWWEQSRALLSAVQQTTYLEALDQYIDYDENDNLRQSLLDKNGERLKDKEGTLKR